MTYDEPLDFDDLEPADCDFVDTTTTSYVDVDTQKSKTTETSPHAGTPLNMTLADFLTTSSNAENVEVWPIELIDQVDRESESSYVFVDNDGYVFC